MPAIDLAHALRAAIEHHQAGRLAEADARYREILARDPTCADAWHFRGVIAHQEGRHEPALEMVARAAALEPEDGVIHSNLGEIYRNLGRLDAAAASLRRALALLPRHASSLNNLASVLAAQGKLDEADACYRQAIAAQPTLASAHHNLGNLLQRRGQSAQAVACFRQAIACDPGLAVAHYNLGTILLELGRFDEAYPCFERTLSLRPDFSEAHNNLGYLCKVRGQFSEAQEHFQRAVDLNPGYAEAHNNLGTVHTLRGRIDEASACFQRALSIRPDYADARNNLASLCKDCGRLDEALAGFRRAIADAPGRADLHSNLILALLNIPSEIEADQVAIESQRWARQHGQPPATIPGSFVRDRSPERRLRIGYVSADFKQHSVAFFLLPLLRSHDREQVHITCYSTNSFADNVTASFQSIADQWRNLAGWSDDDASRCVRDDAIDVLVDLSGHTAGNRLGVFARKSAPVQVSYLGFPASTGLKAIDYRLTDSWADPDGATESFYSEQLVRLPGSAWCFLPLSGSPPIGEPPATRLGCVTFGCFNSMPKVTRQWVALWAQLLQTVPGSRLLMKNFALGSPTIADRMRKLFFEFGIPAERLDLVGRLESPVDHLHCYDRVDVALDTFPYHGTTTTCEALWMGVPVITLAGDRHVSRVGVSLLMNAGLPELVASSPGAYIDAAMALASDHQRLRTLRGSLRERLQRSLLMDASHLARAVEKAYRAMWHRWCAGRTDG